MEKIVNNTVIDVGDTVYLIFNRTLPLSRKEKVSYNTHDAFKALSIFDHVSDDDEDPIVTPYCEVEDSNGNVFSIPLDELSVLPDDNDKRITYYKKLALRIGLGVALIAGFVGFLIWMAFFKHA